MNNENIGHYSKQKKVKNIKISMKKQKIAKKQPFWQKIGKKYEQPFIPNNCITPPCIHNFYVFYVY